MEAPRNFRTAFHGFNREDVVHYLEYINARHTAQVNQLESELEELRGQSPAPANEDCQLELKRLQTKCDVLAAQVEALEAENAQLREAQPAQDVPAASELDIYRRAERTEQEAKDRAELIYFQARSVLNEATAKVDQVSTALTEKSDAVMAQITQLQMAVSNGKHVLQDAAAMMNTIRPNK